MKKLKNYNPDRIRGKVERMKIYFTKTNGNSLVIITDGETAKVFDAAPSGIYDGVDLYSINAAEQLKKHFLDLDSSGNINNYYDIWSDNEISFSEIENELENSEIVFEK